MAYAPSGRRQWVGIAALVLIVAAFLAFSLPRYFTGDPAQSRVPATFALHYQLLVGHVMCASLAIVGAVAQVWPGLRRRHPAVHRRVGRVYVYSAIPAAASAMIIGAATPFGPILAVITNRVWTPVLFVVLQPLQDSFFDGDARRFLWVVAGVGAWLGWTIPTALVALWLRRHQVMAQSSISRVPATGAV
jgi:hypothetical protein